MKEDDVQGEHGAGPNRSEQRHEAAPVLLSYATPAINHRGKIVGITNPGSLVASYLAGAACTTWVSLVLSQRREVAYSGIGIVTNDGLISLVVAGIWSTTLGIVVTRRVYSPMRMPRRQPLWLGFSTGVLHVGLMALFLALLADGFEKGAGLIAVVLFLAFPSFAGLVLRRPHSE